MAAGVGTQAEVAEAQHTGTRQVINADLEGLEGEAMLGVVSIGERGKITHLLALPWALEELSSVTRDVVLHGAKGLTSQRAAS